MTIFELVTFVCAVSYGLDGMLATKACEWQHQGRLFQTEKACLAAAPAVGTPVHAFTVFTGPDGHLTSGKTIDAVRCLPLGVE